MHVPRTADDAHGLRDSLEGVQNAAVIGSGYIELEVAASLRKVGKDVHVVELAPRLLARVASSSLSDCCTKLHATAGVKIYANAACDEILTYEKGHVKAVLLEDGTELTSQLVLASIGVIPDAHFAKKLALLWITAL